MREMLRVRCADAGASLLAAKSPAALPHRLPGEEEASAPTASDGQRQRPAHRAASHACALLSLPPLPPLSLPPPAAAATVAGGARETATAGVVEPEMVDGPSDEDDSVVAERMQR